MEHPGLEPGTSRLQGERIYPHELIPHRVLGSGFGPEAYTELQSVALPTELTKHNHGSGTRTHDLRLMRAANCQLFYPVLFCMGSHSGCPPDKGSACFPLSYEIKL